MDQRETIPCPICHSNNSHNYLTVPDRFQSEEHFSLVQCNDCEMVYLNPRPTITAIGKYYQSEAYDPHKGNATSVFDRVYHGVQRLNNHVKLGWIKKLLRTGKILDIGCGTGEFLKAALLAGYEGVGMEPESRARDHARASGLTVAETLEMVEGTFDIITMWHVLEHVHDLPSLFQQLDRLLVQNGWLLLAVPNRTCLDAKIYGPYWVAYDAPRHLYHFRPIDVMALMEQHGFKPYRIKFLPFDPFYNALLSGELKRKVQGHSSRMGVLGDIWTGMRSFVYGWHNATLASSPVLIFQKTAQ